MSQSSRRSRVTLKTNTQRLVSKSRTDGNSWRIKLSYKIYTMRNIQGTQFT